MNLQGKKIEVKIGKVVITETKEIEIPDSKGIEELKRKLKTELGNIVRSVKSMKERADEIKGLLAKIDEHEKETKQA